MKTVGIKRTLLVAGLLFICHAGASTAALPAAVDGQVLPTLAPMLKRATPAVVNIATVGRVQLHENPLLNDPFFRRFFDLPDRPRQRRTQSLGSGVIVDAAKGYVLTNHHVIDKAHEITVTLRDGRSLEAKLIGADPDSDVAVIQIENDNLTALPIADSEELQVGDFVVAIGNPFGLGQTVTSGIVSALGRSGLGIEGYEDFIQTDASINPGNSGGALVNLRGELVGINTAIIAPGGGNVGIGFAIPVNMARQLMEQLVEHGEVRRGQLGVVVQDLTPELAEAFGLSKTKGTVIARISKGSPADQAGLRVGDAILTVNGKAVKNASQVRNQVGLLRVGEKVNLEILRNGKRKTVAVVIRAPELAKIPGKDIHRQLTGAAFRDLDEHMRERGFRQGVVVAAVEVGSPAWYLGLRAEDVLLSANRLELESVADLLRVARASDRLLLNIQRGHSAQFILIQ